MKYLISILSMIGIVLILIFCPMKQESSPEYLRVHIRANSNSEADQNVKYKVKDEVIESLIPILAEIEDFEEAKNVLEEKIPFIESVANRVLKEEGFSYRSTAAINNEYFPTRKYDELVLEEGFYDALIINLGSGTGDNWWCLVYPAFCFTQTTKTDNIVYISKIWEIINSVF